MSNIQLAIFLGLSGFSVHMVIVVLRQYRKIKESIRLLELAQRRIMEHKEERQRWRKEKDKLWRELDAAKGMVKQ